MQGLVVSNVLGVLVLESGVAERYQELMERYGKYVDFIASFVRTYGRYYGEDVGGFDLYGIGRVEVGFKDGDLAGEFFIRTSRDKYVVFYWSYDSRVPVVTELGFEFDELWLLDIYLMLVKRLAWKIERARKELNID